jgi:alpha-L-fucosidase
MLGFIIHYGLYSVPAYDDVQSARRRTMQNGAEWYMKRLTEKSNFRPISGHQQTKTHHKQHYQDQDYAEFTAYFKPDAAKIEEWFKWAVKVGAEYIILTARHHEGFCLWDTQTTSFKSSIDVIQLFKDYATKYKLRFGIYYSWFEFGKSCTIDYINTVIVPQMEELKQYKPDILWFDGDWELKTKYAKQTANQIAIDLKATGVEVNDRIALGQQDLNFLGNASYRVYSDRYMPRDKPQVPWEHINTIGLSWGYNTEQEANDYKTGQQLHKLYEQVHALGGRFLLNLSVDASGGIDPNEVKSLQEFESILRSGGAHQPVPRRVPPRILPLPSRCVK